MSRAHLSRDCGITDPAAKPLDHSEDLLMLGSTDVRTDVQLVVERDCPASEPLPID
jgi:hypothetical protein